MCLLTKDKVSLYFFFLFNFEPRMLVLSDNCMLFANRFILADAFCYLELKNSSNDTCTVKSIYSSVGNVTIAFLP